MDENSACLFPKQSVPQIIIDQHIRWVHDVEALVFGGAGDHFDRGKMIRSPGNLLRLRPSAFWASGKNYGLQVSDSLVEVWGIGHERKVTIEFAASADPAPEFLGTQDSLSLPGILPKELSGRGIEVG